MDSVLATSVALTQMVSAEEKSPGPTEAAATVIDLFEQFRTPLLRYLVTLGLSIQDGEEITQEVFLALFQHLRKGKPQDNLRGWIFRVAHNLAMKQFSSKTGKVQRSSMPLDDVATELASSLPTPEESFDQKRTDAQIKAVIKALPEQQRRCLYLRAEGLRYREIAEILEISLGSVANALEQALLKLNRVREQAGRQA